MTFTPMAMSARLLSHCARHQMAPIEQEEQRQGEQHVQPEQREPELPIIVPTQQPVQEPDRSGDHRKIAESEGQHHLPSERRRMIVAEGREGPPYPEVEDQEDRDLEGAQRARSGSSE